MDGRPKRPPNFIPALEYAAAIARPLPPAPESQTAIRAIRRPAWRPREPASAPCRLLARTGAGTLAPNLLSLFNPKGDHLAETEDTKYKERVFEALQFAFNPSQSVEEEPASYGALTVRDGPMRGTFQLVFNQASFNVVKAALGRP